MGREGCKGVLERWRRLGGGRFILLAALLAALAVYAYLHQGGEKKPIGREHKPVVKTMVLQRSDLSRHILLSGQTVADASINLAPKYNGRIAEVYVNLGDWVEEGQVLLVQDTADLDISIRQQVAAAGAAGADAREAAAAYAANYLKARNDFELEQSRYERNVYLFSIGAISQDRLDEIK